MFDFIGSVFSVLWEFLKFIIIPVGAVLAVIGFSVVIAVLLDYSGGKRRPEGRHRVWKKTGLLRRLFIQFPRQFARDYFDRPKDWFPYQGVIVYTGRQGSGKTVALVEQTLRMQYEYPSCLCISNLGYAYQNDELVDWRQLIDYKNGHQGVIVQMDEMQNWFSSNQSKNFPPGAVGSHHPKSQESACTAGDQPVFQSAGKALEGTDDGGPQVYDHSRLHDLCP